ncbi:holin-associated N-acetylmuramidase [Paracoccus albus]|uniref:holin-associated N-acetylmuramidase n=1 Tax=Paracoccus albus TaxID=3017784 RepID=UPI0022F00F4E|nr:holin-associated N-acetylmuramidase [Paracoccus albus]WBU60860.1 holin-associated N-acetylmuramidase [Paracoccus albus]
MKTVDEIAAEIVAREGGFVNDQDDPGGATKYGVTIGTMRRLGLDIDGDGHVNTADVKALSRDRAAAIFKRHYFERPGIGKLPTVLHATVFDMYVNAGANAVKILQRMVSRMGFPASDDGVIGPRTAAAVTAATKAAPDHIVDAYGIERRNYYYAIADGRPASRKYAKTRKGGKGGWIKRAESFISGRYRLTESQHRERTAAWA